MITTLSRMLSCTIQWSLLYFRGELHHFHHSTLSLCLCVCLVFIWHIFPLKFILFHTKTTIHSNTAERKKKRKNNKILASWCNMSISMRPWKGTHIHISRFYQLESIYSFNIYLMRWKTVHVHQHFWVHFIQKSRNWNQSTVT